MSTTSTPSVPQQRSLADVVDIVSGFGFPKELQGKPKGDLPFFKVGDISIAWNSGQKNLTQAQHYLDQAEASSIRAKAFPKGTVVFAKIGEAIRLNRRAILGQPSIVDNNVMGLIPKEGVVDPTYLFYWSLMLRLGDISQATTVPSVRKSDVEQLSFPWLPLDQQKRIVAEIEKQFSRLDEAVSNLKRVKANLKRYKAAVLKAAASGRLVETEAELARREGRSFETGGQLLQRILETRRSQWQGKGKYKEPAAPDTTDLPELPEGWVWASVEQIVENLDGVRVPVHSKDRESKQGPYPYYGASGVIDHVDDFLFDGDYLLIAEDGANLLSRSTPIAFRASGKFWVNNHAHIVQTLGGIPLAFIENYLNGKDLARYVTGSAQPKLTQAAMNKISVPLPGASEQHSIVGEVDRRLSLLRETTVQVDANLLRAVRLRQSILTKVFSGGLQQSEKVARTSVERLDVTERQHRNIQGGSL